MLLDTYEKMAATKIYLIWRFYNLRIFKWNSVLKEIPCFWKVVATKIYLIWRFGLFNLALLESDSVYANLNEYESIISQILSQEMTIDQAGMDSLCHHSHALV